MCYVEREVVGLDVVGGHEAVDEAGVSLDGLGKEGVGADEPLAIYWLAVMPTCTQRQTHT